MRHLPAQVHRRCFCIRLKGIHGDLGMVTANDVVIAISNSGETSELLGILPSLKRIGAPIIAFCGRDQSTLAKHADVVLDISVEKEACPLGLAPTASTTATLAMGGRLGDSPAVSPQVPPRGFCRISPRRCVGP